ncbi:glutaredoxin domain-containing protein [Bacillus velezensis]|uniref:glutaredoxin domain-containing protein n=1 Tax=Bacillus velezensis TaxID=492670 RepID=UPI0004585D0B|nr:glutaredoxin domain-containing protein [Bacillus velezensis]AHZ16040.1 SPBc2 prophage-derived thioredoxin-like protein yosR [Bacillus velezensis SQR9]MDH2300075.1 glutaredoxin domain-containing protein [Bacillus velezensis]MDR4960853.1 glutaredoxin domain-containing protein [Bacillus velezensis]MEC2162765.1 glutaredoxin domain-containing protein [Bacillus velezensis]MEC2196076.1 glutaredoxin domain-containing protein [Bacillus velezensis]
MRLIKLEQPNCNPCKMVSNYLNDAGVEYETVDVTQNPEVAAQYGVMGVPVTILLNEQGEEVKRSIGFIPGELDTLINDLRGQ